MADAAYAIPNFHGGEISAFAQGRFDKPDYRVSLNVCLNAFPLEIGTWTRRPGTHARRPYPRRRGGAQDQIRLRAGLRGHAGIHRRLSALPQRRGADHRQRSAGRGRGIRRQSGRGADHQRGHMGRPATRWYSPAPRRRCWKTASSLATKVDTTHFSLADAITGATIDGATLGALVAGATVRGCTSSPRPMSAASGPASARCRPRPPTSCCAPPWPRRRSPSTRCRPTGTNPVFAIAPRCSTTAPISIPSPTACRRRPGAKVGIVTITLAFPAYVATTAYRIGDFVTSGGVNYISLVDQNVGSAPPSANWAATSARRRDQWRAGIPRHRHRPAGAAVLGTGGMGGRHGLCRPRPQPRPWWSATTRPDCPAARCTTRRRWPRPAKSPAPT
jgi:hypothetical protein